MGEQSASQNVNIIVENTKSKNPILIEGFPGIGLVGSIAGQYIVDQLKLRSIGSIDSRLFPPVAVLLGGLVRMPAQIYEGDEILVVSSDIPIHPAISYDLSRALLDWAQQVNMRELISIAGIYTMKDQHRVFGAATTDAVREKIKGKTTLFGMGTLSGISGRIMTECGLRGIPAIALLGETQGVRPDPKAAVDVIEVLNQLYNWNIDTSKLLEQAERIELELHRLAEEVRKAEEHEALKKGELPMYG
jgi:uncharacterized protein